MATNSLSLSCLLLAAFLFLLPSLLHPVAGDLQSPEMIKEFLDEHNKYRKQEGMPLLKWDVECEKYAKKYAEERSGDCALVHSSGNFGENLFWGTGPDWKPKDAIKAWYDEKPYYDYKTNECIDDQQCLHYTQLMWRTTEKVGCWKGVCKKTDTFIGCNYDPHGNIQGARPF